MNSTFNDSLFLELFLVPTNPHINIKCNRAPPCGGTNIIREAAADFYPVSIRLIKANVYCEYGVFFLF